VADGAVYTTFVVVLAKDTEAVIRVLHYRSRKGADGDDTLPP
jgi:hypothetical protein